MWTGTSIPVQPSTKPMPASRTYIEAVALRRDKFALFRYRLPVSTTSLDNMEQQGNAAVHATSPGADLGGLPTCAASIRIWCQLETCRTG